MKNSDAWNVLVLNKRLPRVIVEYTGVLSTEWDWLREDII